MNTLNHILCCHCFWDWSTFWSAVTAIFTAAAAVGVFVVRHQMRWEAWLKAQQLFTDEKFVNARGIVFLISDKGFDLSKWTKKDIKKLTDFMPDAKEENFQEVLKKAQSFVCRKMDEMAHLAPYLGEVKFLETWDNPFAELWKILKDFIMNEREQKAKWSKKWIKFQIIGEKAIKRIEKQIKE